MARDQSLKTVSFKRILPIILVIGGIVGLIASFIIMNDKLKLMENPGYLPSCSINPVLSCGSIMKSAQAKAFGFPNPFIGLAAFPVLITVGAAILACVTRLKRWFWLGLEAGAIFGLGFVHWLFFQSVYKINALCIYCIAVWIVTIAGFWYVTLYNLEQGHIKAPKPLARVVNFAKRHHVDILISWYLIITALIVEHFWYYFKTWF
ncbi:MAG TPA: vitamin K epoxide reductase family protein [Candidatus Saccharimonadales bacterium]|nr:vitamin K epoxide reductase family protein [Candidatus Saccharimonadales bacterium]